MTDDRIFFEDNPYPNGHKIIEFIWSAYLDEEGLWFDFHLKTDNYYAEDTEQGQDYDEDDPELVNDDWHSKIVWGNYHRCTMSSTQWGNGGILLDTKHNKLDFANLELLQLAADKMPADNTMPPDMEWDDLAFHIYLLGHDACANHQIDIAKIDKNNFHIKWTGNIALAYAGQDKFKYHFNANIANAKFDGFDYPQELSQAQAREQFAKHIINLDDFEFVDLNPKSNKREYKFSLKNSI